MDKKEENSFARFFSQKDYITLKNQLFNYKFRKHIIARAYKKYGSHRSKSRLLDIGCGISPVSPYQNQTTFIDSDKNAMIFLKKLGHKTLNGNANSIPLKNRTIDSVFCSEVLEHVPNHKIAIREFNRILKIGGILFITVPTHMKYWAFDDDYVGHLRRFDPKKLVGELKDENFEIIDIKPIGSYIERELTKMLVRKAMTRKNNDRVGRVQMDIFKFANKIFLALTYLGYIFNNKENSSIILIVARKAD